MKPKRKYIYTADEKRFLKKLKKIMKRTKIEKLRFLFNGE